MAQADAYIIAARRTALGRVGGLHARRRIEELAATLVATVLADGKITPDIVDGIVLGNTTEPANPARLVALAAGLSESADAMTLDRQCAGGLDAIVAACRMVAAGDADVMIAGGAEALSTAPWRVARPTHLHQLPRFLSPSPMTVDVEGEPLLFEASERLARDLQLTREMLDAAAFASHRAAFTAREQRRFIGEIVPLRHTPEEARDELVRDIDLAELTALQSINGHGSLTTGNSAHQADGAAFVAVVGHRIWSDLGQPPALRYVRSVNVGVPADREASAALFAIDKLANAGAGLDVPRLAAIETSETCPAQVIAFSRRFGVEPDRINRAGGAVARGHPLSAAGAVLVVRLFSDLVRSPVTEVGPGALGLASLTAMGGLGTATLFETA